jgi:Fe2+ transport system protein FeoA
LKLCCTDDKTKYEVVSVKGKNSNRMAELGLNAGIEIYVISTSHDMIQIELRDYKLALRKCDVENVDVKVLD